jgi:hypothetical protein
MIFRKHIRISKSGKFGHVSMKINSGLQAFKGDENLQRMYIRQDRTLVPCNHTSFANFLHLKKRFSITSALANLIITASSSSEVHESHIYSLAQLQEAKLYIKV